MKCANFTDVTWIVESGLVVRAWDLAVRTMRAGEKSRFFCKDSYVYTNETDSAQQNTIVYDIELLYWQGFVHPCLHLVIQIMESRPGLQIEITLYAVHCFWLY